MEDRQVDARLLSAIRPQQACKEAQLVPGETALVADVAVDVGSMQAYV